MTATDILPADVTQTLPQYHFRKPGRHAKRVGLLSKLWQNAKDFLVLDPLPFSEEEDQPHESRMRRYDAVLDIPHQLLRLIAGMLLRLPSSVGGVVASFAILSAIGVSVFWVPYVALKMSASVEALALQSVACLALLAAMTWAVSRIRRTLVPVNGHLARNSRRLMIVE
jgi:hypothetical protein